MVILVSVALVASAYMGQLLPKIIFDLSKNYSNGDKFLITLWDLFYLLMAIFWIRFGFQITLNRYVMKLIENIRNICYENWLNAFDFNHTKSGVKAEDEFPLGEVIARIMSDTQSIRDLLTSGALTIVFNIIFVASCAYGFISIDSFLGGVVVVAEIGFSLILIFGSKYMRKIFHEVRSAKSQVSRQIANVSGGTSDAFFFGHNNYAEKSGVKHYSVFMEKQLKANVWDATYYSVAESLYPMLLALVIFFAPHANIVEGAIIFALVDLIQRSIDPIKNIAGKIAVIQRALTGVVRVQSFYSNLSSRLSSVPFENSKKQEFKSVQVNIPYFEYPKRKKENDRVRFHLRDISFTGKSGDLIGIVGVSGCGKSTLLKILSGNILPTHGGVHVEFENGQQHFYPGEDGEGLALYRELSSIVSQDSHVFSETLRFNITMGMDKKIDQSIESFWSWVKKELPYLTTWGVELDDKVDVEQISAGQKQLISALRACYLHKSLVFFDEISSALDSELEESLRKIVLIIQRQSLTFIVAHRVETIVDSDLIIVMSDGKIVAQGHHRNLMQESVYYQDFISKLN